MKVMVELGGEDNRDGGFICRVQSGERCKVDENVAVGGTGKTVRKMVDTTFDRKALAS